MRVTTNSSCKDGLPLQVPFGRGPDNSNEEDVRVRRRLSGLVTKHTDLSFVLLKLIIFFIYFIS